MRGENRLIQAVVIGEKELSDIGIDQEKFKVVLREKMADLEISFFKLWLHNVRRKVNL